MSALQSVMIGIAFLAAASAPYTLAQAPKTAESKSLGPRKVSREDSRL